MAEESTSRPTVRQWIAAALVKHFLPLGFLFVLVVALVWPFPGDHISEWKVGSFRIVQTINVCTIFVISGLTLKTADIMAAFQAYVGFIYGIVAILAITPFIGFGLVEIPFRTEEFKFGFAVFASVPTTLTSGVTLVGQAGGNTALALMLTVCSNMLGIVTTPYAVSFLVDTATEVKLDALQLLVKLVLTILLPLLMGKLIRELSPNIQKFVSVYKVPLSLISNGSLICVVWQTLSRSRDELIAQDALSILEVIGAGVAMHFAYLAWNYVAVKLLRIQPKEQTAVLLMASQKTLPVSVTVISFLDKAEVGDLGLLTIPCIIGHMSQLFIDAYIAGRWAVQNQESEPVKKCGNDVPVPEESIPEIEDDVKGSIAQA